MSLQPSTGRRGSHGAPAAPPVREVVGQGHGAAWTASAETRLPGDRPSVREIRTLRRKSSATCTNVQVKQCIFRSFNQAAFDARRFNENLFTYQCEKEDKKAEGFQISHFYWSFSVHVTSWQ